MVRFGDDSPDEMQDFLESASGMPALMTHCNKLHVTSMCSYDPNSIWLIILRLFWSNGGKIRMNKH